MSLKYEFKQKHEVGKLTRILWKAAGADEQILQHCLYSDHVKYACLGGIILATGILAGVAATFAVYTVFGPKGNAVEVDAVSIPVLLLSLVIGSGWGLMIFNLDRYIVASTGKGDGTENITSKEAWNALPRLFMGCIIALTISKPLEIRIFKSEIDAKLQEKQKIMRQDLDSLTHASHDRMINQIDDEIRILRGKEDELQDKVDAMQQQYTEEARIITVGPRALAVKAEMEKLERQLTSLRAQNAPKVQELEKRKKDKMAQMEKELELNNSSVNNLDGLLERIIISHELSPWISIFITLLFLAIEITPIFFKLMIIKSPYDYLEENKKELILAERGIYKTYDSFNENGRSVKGEVYKFLEAENKLHDRKKLYEAQEHLSNRLIEEWKKLKEKDINDNLDNYIDTKG